MNSGFRPEAGKSSGNSFSPSSTPLMPSTECACNPNTPPDYLRFLTQFPNLHADLALNPALPPDLEQWIKGHPDPRVQQNLRVRAQKLTDSGNKVDRAKQSSVSSSTEAAEADEAANEENFDATTLAGSNSPVTKSLPAAPDIQQQSKAALPPEISPAVTGNLPPLTPTQSLPQPAAYSSGRPSAALYAPSPNFAPGFPPPPGGMGYQPLPGQYPKPRRKRRWLIPLIATLVAIAVLGGGLGVYFALAGFRHVGYDSPEELADALKASLDDSDLIRIAQMSAPSEDLFALDALQLNKDLQKYISTSASKAEGGSGQLVDKVSDLTSIMHNLDIDTSRLDSKVESLSDDISRINYSGRIDVKIKDRDKLKASLDKLVFNNQNAPKKEKQLNNLLEAFDNLEKDGFEYKSRDSLAIMSVKEEGKWYYSVSMSFFDSYYYSPDNSTYENPHYDVNWVNPGETPSDSSQFAKELSGAITRVSNLDELTSGDIMRFLDIPERRIVMIYASPEAKGENSPGMNLKVKLSEDRNNSYGFAFNLDNLIIDVDDMRWEIAEKKLTYTDENNEDEAILTEIIKNGKLQLVAKSTNQGLKLSFSGSLANLFSNLDYDSGYEYFRENREYFLLQEKGVEDVPVLRPYKRVILGFIILYKKGFAVAV